MIHANRFSNETNLEILYSPGSARIILELSCETFDNRSLSLKTGYSGEVIDNIIRILVYYGIINHDNELSALTSLGKAYHEKIKDIIICFYEFKKKGFPEENVCETNLEVVIDTLESKSQIIAPLLRGDPWLRKIVYLSGIQEDIPVDMPGNWNKDQFEDFRKFIVMDDKGSVIKIRPEWIHLINSLSMYYRFVDFITENRVYLNLHRLDLLPEFAINTLYKLMPAGLYCDPPVNFKQSFNFYIDILGEAERIKGVSTWAKSEIAGVMVQKLQEGVPVDLVIAPELAVEMLSNEPYSDLAKQVADISWLSVRIACCRIGTGMTVTDKCLSVGFFLEDGLTYDSVFDFICRSDDAINWGEELFAYYHRNSIPLEEFIKNQIG